MKKKLFYLKLMFLTLWSVQMNAQDVLDQDNGNFNTQPNVSGTYYQTFQAGLSGALSKITLGAYAVDGNSILVSITATDASGVPTGPDLTSETVFLSTSFAFYDVVFTNPILVTAGTKYAIKLYKETSYHPFIGISSFYANGTLYAGAPLNTIPTEVDPAHDLYFRTFVSTSLYDINTITQYTGCSGLADGSISLAPTNGTAPYSYAWTSTVAGFTNPGNVSTISNLVPGAYTCVVTDATMPTAKTKTFNYTIVDNGPNRDAYVINNTTCGTYGLTINPLATPLYQNSFTTSDGITLSGDAVRETSNQIKLVPDQNNKNGKVIINNLPTTLPADFEVNWRFFHLQKDGADGYSFNLGNDSFPGAFEDGTNQGLAVKFKIFGQDQVSIKWNGTEIVAPVNTTLELGRWQDAKLTVVAGKVTLYVNGKQIANEVTIPSYAQNNAYKIIFAARTGGSSNETSIDDVTFGDLSAFEYSIDGTTFQTTNTFSNITLPTNRTLPIWLKQNGCARKIRDYVFATIEPIDINVAPSSVCNPTAINVEIPASLLANAEFYSNDFSTKNGYIFGGSATKTAGGILLTKNESDNKGYLIVNKPEAFDKNGFKFTINHKTATTNGADGFSINLGNLTPIVNFTVDPENGVTNGLAVRFKTFGTDNLQVYYNNTQLSMAGQPSITIETGNTETYSVIVKDNMVKVYQGTTEKFSATLPAAYATDDFANHQFVVAARTGGSANENLISSVKINNAQTLQASLDNVTFTDVPDGATTALPLMLSQIVLNKTKVYFKVKNGCSFTTFKEITANKIAAVPVAPTVQERNASTRFADLQATAEPGYEIRWYVYEAQANANVYAASVSATSNLIIDPSFTEVLAVQYPIGITTCGSPFKKVFLTNATISNNILTQIGNEGDAPNAVTSVVTTTQLSQILPAITGVVTNNGYLYQGYIDNNPNLFSSPATAAEVQAMVNAVNAQVASNTVLTQIGNEGDAPNTVTSVVTVAQLGVILPAITGIVAANEAAYQAYIDANPNLFSSPLATPAEVQAMVTAVNAQVASNAVLTQIGNEGDSPNTVASNVTDTQLLQIVPAITGVMEGNQAAYQAYIDANPDLFSTPATAAQVQAMVTAVNAQVAVQAASNAVLTQIGNEGDAPNTVPSTVTVAQLGQILPAITGVVTANQAAYQAYIDANPALFASPATATQVQAMVTAVNATQGATAASNAVLTQIGNEGDTPNTVTSAVTVAQLGQILPAITGIVAANELAYQAYIDANPTMFSAPATAAEVQAMITAVNTQVAAQAASNAVLTQIGNEGDSPNTVASNVTDTQLLQIVPAITGVMESNQAAYQAYIDANPDLFSTPATAAEVQAMVTAVNAQVVAQAASNTVLTQIGNEGDAPNTVTSIVTVAQIGQILPAITGIVTANQTAYQAYIDANPTMFSAPATAAEVQAMVTAVNASLSTDSFDATTKLVVYPNPSNAIFNINIDQNASYELFDIVGKQLKSGKINLGTSQIDVSNYNSGIYLLKITNETNQTKTVRLIKQ